MDNNPSEESKWADDFNYSMRDYVGAVSMSDPNIEDDASQNKIKNANMIESV